MPEGFETLEFLEGAAVEAFGLDLIAEEEGPGVGGFGEAVKAIGHEEVAVLGLGDFVVVVDEGLTDHADGAAGASKDSSKQLVNMPVSRRAARRRDCWARAMRSTAKSSWELTGW